MIQQYNIYLYWIYSANIWGIYDSWRVSVRPSGAGLGNMCQLNIYICIGYILPTFGGYMTIGGYLCALWALGWGSARLGNMCQLNFIYLYWIYFANIWGIYDSWRVSVHPSTVIYPVWWMSGVVDVRCGGCPI